PCAITSFPIPEPHLSSIVATARELLDLEGLAMASSRRILPSLVCLFAFARAASAAPPAPPAANLPALPGSNTNGGAQSGPPEEQLRRGVVQVEQGGRPIAIGTILPKDGRVLTALSGLGAVTEPEVRFADGTVVKTKIGHKDKAWDLALLIPQAGSW